MRSNESAISQAGLQQVLPGALTLSEELDQLLASKTFSRSEQLKRLLVYLRDATISTDPAVWSETAIGANAFGRRDFNPKLDTIVRVEMRRLRQKLDEYYAGEGAESAVRMRFERIPIPPLRAQAICVRLRSAKAFVLASPCKFDCTDRLDF